MASENLQCKNCESQLLPEFTFCPNCGQKVNEELTLQVLFYNTICNYFSFDARFFKSFWPLIAKPGYLAKKYLEGKRLMFLHPAQMYLFISVVFFSILSFSISDQTETLNEELKRDLTTKQKVSVLDSIRAVQSDSTEREEARAFLKKNQWLSGLDDKAVDSILSNESVEKNKVSFGFDVEEIDSLINIDAKETDIYKSMGMESDAGWFQRKAYAQALKFYKKRDGGSILKTFIDTIPIALFILLPLFALILKLLYYNRGRYAHHLVFSFYFFSFLFIVFSFVFGLNLIWDIPDWLDWLTILSTYFYLFIALKRFYQNGWFWSFFKCNVATFTFMALVLPTAAVIIGFYAFLFY
ncbi:DUF3667 domain-containing protein [Sediminibacter sp. Hel_I_10]|uniref:DUF3667 domain-containing protein n=1 Tax=Sediminibacter sp. Hel_I_10 TaxID=1392490 RepID=UPI00047C205E|nr:DUF3667 domain-containing protein [Sediminibacter sp. Hel_I_10]